MIKIAMEMKMFGSKLRHGSHNHAKGRLAKLAFRPNLFAQVSGILWQQ